MPRSHDFVSIPFIPDTGNEALNKVLLTMQENIELLAGLRGNERNHAVLKGDITQDYPETITAVSVEDVAALQETLRKLMVQLKT